MTKLVLNNVGDLTSFTTAAAVINANSAATSTAMENTLSRDGTVPNTMGANFDMNGFRILNLPAPATVNEPARLVDVVTNPTITVPPVGTSGATVPLLNGNNTFSGLNTLTQDLTISKAVGQFSENVTAATGRVALSYTGAGGPAFYLKDTSAALDIKYLNIDHANGVTSFRSLTDAGAIKQEFFNLNSSTSTINFSVPITGTLNAASNYLATSFTNTNASGFVTHTVTTNAGALSIQGSNTAAGATALYRWTGLGGQFFDQQNATGSIIFRTGATPTPVLEINAVGGLIVSTPGAITSAIQFTDTSASGRNWVFGPRVGTGSQDLFALTGGTFGTIFYINGVTGASIGVGAVLSQGATQGVGYAIGAGGTVTQATSKATGVTLNKVTGLITTNAASLAAATIVSFNVTCAAMAATDMVVVSHESAGTTGAYTVNARQNTTGNFIIDIRNNTAGALAEAIVLRYAIIKSVNT